MIVIVNEQHHVKCALLYVLTNLTCTVAQHL